METDNLNDNAGGLTTKLAILKLHQDIKEFLDNLEPHLHNIQSWKYIIQQAYSRKSVHSTFRWTSILFLILSIIGYMFALKYGHFTSSLPLVIENIILLLVLIMNIGIIYWNSRSRYLELYNKALKLSDKVYECANNEKLIKEWSTHVFYANLNNPTSPCITLQCTYRDGELVNLPVCLLVRGDVILLGPGHRAPTKCRRIEKVIKKKKTNDFTANDDNNFSHRNSANHIYEYIFAENDSSKETLDRDEIFTPKVDNEPETFTAPRFRKCLKPSKFLVIETPYVNDLQITLHSINRRSPTAFEKELRLIFGRYLEHISVPILFILVLLFSIAHYCYVEMKGNHSFDRSAAISLIILRPIMAILPLLPMALPLLWLILNIYGLIKLEVVYEYFYQNEEKLLKSAQSNESFDSKTNINLTQNSFQNGTIQNGREYLLKELNPERIQIFPSKNLLLKKIIKEMFLFFYNDCNGNLWRTANLLHVLGSITALCCVDKKGILSWPNPIADKVFFLSSAQKQQRKSSYENNNNNEINNEMNNKSVPNPLDHNANKKSHSALSNVTRAECVELDITLDPHAAYGLQFDDMYWNRYLSNLKPLGLAILLNTCNQATQNEFVKFCDHILCESLTNEMAIPVVNKRCLCELARQIGFKENAIKDYEYCYQVGIFRHIRPEVIQKGKFAKSLNFSRLRMPFSNMTCAVIRDMFTNTCQLFSQGTGDLVLDTCAEYWNGQCLALLTDYERKKILDFYQRTSLTSYCCSFAYLPLNNENCANLESMNYYKDYFIELPPESSHLFPSQRSLDSQFRGLEIESHCSFPNVAHKLDCNQSFDSPMYLNSKVVGHHLSTDSISKHIAYNSGDIPGSQIQKSIICDGNKAKQNELHGKLYLEESQLDQTMKKVINGVFIGMATLQYQACSDFVRLVELLDAACIRFVHFSKENELRSRVFSEKMGLESGWNCHISLLNDSIEPNTATNNETKKTLMDTSASNKNKANQQRLSLSSSNSFDSSDDSMNSVMDECTNSDDIKRRAKQNSVCSDRSESTFNRIRCKEFRSSSKASCNNSNPLRNLSPSPSHNTTTSTITEHSAPIAFDMSNRAKLPKGINNIRPHLENVDNVPLLVSLFTDCTPEATKEMIKIMQEYEEVVCVIGSMANESNMPVFLQADASIGIDPMYPHVCKTQPIRPVDLMPSKDLDGMTPIQLANQLVALPCSMTMQRHNAIIFYYLILIARDYMMRMRNVFQFFLSSCLSLSLAQMLSSMAFLPPLFSPGIVLWLSLIVIPFLSVSLMGIEPDSTVMNVATGKKLHLNRKTIAYFFFCYCIKFTPSMLICTLMFAVIIGTSCEQMNIGNSFMDHCWMFGQVKTVDDIKTEHIWSSHLLIAQTIASFFLVLYLVIISIGFVHRNHLLWHRCPFANICWLCTSIILIFCHIIVCMLEIYIYVPEVEITEHFLKIIPFYIWIIGFLWPFLLISINIFTKRREIKMNTRQQRRARLDFGTKLGMNSPF